MFTDDDLLRIAHSLSSDIDSKREDSLAYDQEGAHQIAASMREAIRHNKELLGKIKAEIDSRYPDPQERPVLKSAINHVVMRDS